MDAVIRPSWEEYALRLAEAARSRSEDPWVKIGAVVLRADNSVAGVGYNGAPPGVDVDYSDRDGRRDFMIHAETNALRYCSTNEVQDGLLAVTGTPCPQCLVNASAYGITRVIFRELLENYPYETTLHIADVVGINLERVVPELHGLGRAVEWAPNKVDGS